MKLLFVLFLCVAGFNAQAHTERNETSSHRRSQSHARPSAPPSAAQVCSSLMSTSARAEQICQTYGHTILKYTDLQFNGSDRREIVLAYGCDCGRPYHRPAQIKNPMLCIKSASAPWDTCINYDCERSDRSPWCDDGTD